MQSLRGGQLARHFFERRLRFAVFPGQQPQVADVVLQPPPFLRVRRHGAQALLGDLHGFRVLPGVRVRLPQQVQDLAARRQTRLDALQGLDELGPLAAHLPPGVPEGDGGGFVELGHSVRALQVLPARLQERPGVELPPVHPAHLPERGGLVQRRVLLDRRAPGRLGGGEVASQRLDQRLERLPLLRRRVFGVVGFELADALNHLLKPEPAQMTPRQPKPRLPPRRVARVLLDYLPVHRLGFGVASSLECLRGFGEQRLGAGVEEGELGKRESALQQQNRGEQPMVSHGASRGCCEERGRVALASTAGRDGVGWTSGRSKRVLFSLDAGPVVRRHDQQIPPHRVGDCASVQ